MSIFIFNIITFEKKKVKNVSLQFFPMVKLREIKLLHLNTMLQYMFLNVDPLTFAS